MKQLILITTFFHFCWVFSQQELVLNLQSNLLQSNLLNPAVQLNDHKWAVSLPSVYFNYSNSGFSYNDVIKRDEQSETAFIDFDQAINQLNNENYLFVDFNINFLTAAYKYKNTQFGFYLSERLSVNINYPKALLELIWLGNEPFLGDTLNVGPGLNATKYREWGFSYSQKINRWEFGGRIKLINGLANISTAKNDIKFHTNEEDYALSVQTNYSVNTSRIEGFQEALSPFSGISNNGFGFDFGAIYNRNQKWRFSASLLDLGIINWKDNASNYQTKGSFYFDGIDAFSFFNGDSLAVSDHLDTLNNLLQVEQHTKSYRTTLLPSMYFSTRYKIDSTQSASIQVFGEFFNNRLIPAYTIGYDKKLIYLKNGLEIDIGGYWSYRNNSFANLGFGLQLRYKSFSFFIVGDNLLSFLFPQKEIPLNRLDPLFKPESQRSLVIPGNMRNYNFRFGINLLFGKNNR